MKSELRTINITLELGGKDYFTDIIYAQKIDLDFNGTITGLVEIELIATQEYYLPFCEDPTPISKVDIDSLTQEARETIFNNIKSNL